MRGWSLGLALGCALLMFAILIFGGIRDLRYNSTDAAVGSQINSSVAFGKSYLPQDDINIKPVTVVSSCYHIPSKHKHEEYIQWMKYFLPNIPCRLLVFTDNESSALIRELRSPFPDRTKIVVREFSELTEYRRLDMWKRQHEIDPERKTHHPELYIIWNEKVHLMQEAVEMNPFNSDYFLWTDIGVFRDPDLIERFVTYPDANFTATLLGKDKVFFLEVEEIPGRYAALADNGLPKHDFKKDWFFLAGGYFGGHADAVREYRKKYLEVLDKLVAMGRFVGKDQNVMNAMAMMYPKLIKRVLATKAVEWGKPLMDKCQNYCYALYFLSKRAS